MQHLLTLDELRPLLLCHMANAICEALVHAPPMNMLFYKPRGSTIVDVHDAIVAAIDERRRQNGGGSDEGW